MRHFKHTGFLMIGNRYTFWTEHIKKLPIIGVLGYLFSENWIIKGKTKFWGKLGLKYYLSDIKSGNRKYY